MSKWLTIVVLIIFCNQDCSCLNICSTGEWDGNATTVAGSSDGSSGYSSSSLSSPSDVYVNNNEDIYVLDSGNYRVQRFPPNVFDAITVVNGSYGTELNQFSTMNVMNIDADENIYILDGGNGRVTKWTPGASSGIIVAGGYGNDTNQMVGASGMFIDSNTSTIWISDSNNNRIIKWLSPTMVEYVCGSSGVGLDQFHYPQGIFVDIENSNTLYVADTGNHRIQMWLPNATSGITVAGQTNVPGSDLDQLSGPVAVIGDGNGVLYIVDTGNNRIMRWPVNSNKGEIIAGGSTYGSLPQQLFLPYNIRFDSHGSLIVVDYGNNRIQKFQIACLPNTMNGSTSQPIGTTTPTQSWSVTTNRSSIDSINSCFKWPLISFFIIIIYMNNSF